LEWKDNGDPDGDDYRDYYVKLYRDGNLVDEVGWKYTQTSWTVSNLTPGTYTWQVSAGDGEDDRGFTSAWSFTVDTAAPTGDLIINHGWESAHSVRVPLDLTASDTHSSVGEMRLGASCSSLGAWQPFQSRLWWQLSGQHGETAQVCVQFRDRAGNTSSPLARSTLLNFYPAQPTSASYHLRSDVSALSGEPHQSATYRLHSTAGQALASGNYATSSAYRAALGFWPRIQQNTSLPPGNQPPRRPTLLTPAIGSTTDDNTPTFTWQDQGDPDNGPQPTRFRVSLRSLDGTQVAESGWLSSTEWTPPALSDGTYQWRVKAWDGAAESAWTGEWNLTIETAGASPEPYFHSDYTIGGPGSTFIFTAGHFPAGAQTTVAVREPGMSDFETILQLPIPDSGTLVFVLRIPSTAAPGEYLVRLTVAGEEPLLATAERTTAQTWERPLTIVANDPAHTDPSPEGVPTINMPGTIPGVSTIYIPMVRQ
jgi:hypothetical protein